MKFKILSAFLLFIFIIMIFAVADDSKYKTDEMKFAGTGLERILGEKDIKGEIWTEDRLKGIFTARNAKLAKYFSCGIFDEIGKYYGEEGVLWTPEGKRIQGVEKISGYFMSLKEMGVKEIRFKTQHVIIHELTDVLNKKNPSPEDIVDVIYEYILFSFELEGSSDPGGNSWAQWYHPRRCFI